MTDPGGATQLLEHRIRVFAHQVMRRRDVDLPQFRSNRGTNIRNLLQIGDLGSADRLHGYYPQFIPVMLSCSTVASDTQTKYGT